MSFHMILLLYNSSANCTWALLTVMRKKDYGLILLIGTKKSNLSWLKNSWSELCTTTFNHIPRADYIIIHLHSNSNHVVGTAKERKSYIFVMKHFHQRSNNNTAHTLLSVFSPPHHWLIILSCSTGAVSSDTLYSLGVKDGWYSVHSLFI